MGFFSSLFGKKDKNIIFLRELIEYNADIIEKTEGKTKIDAEYLAICTLLDTIHSDPLNWGDGQQAHREVMEILLDKKDKYSKHMSDVLAYLTVQSGELIFKQEFQEEMDKRHE